MLMPKRVKRRRVFRGRMKGKALRGNFLAYGDYGIEALDGTIQIRRERGFRIYITVPKKKEVGS